ncbi:ThiF family protein [Trichomonas vaginalis G3]|uniref:NEDD8-activating enzyme E1 catalytic subunit n=1 Tax=Trichomonas vaginalis (strain ATCC PRA-98 / G3) TaxID=412133 RepID=A2D863_TRIV3|nr:ubiquitin-activating enzyme E1 family [Trichomonas vaginalis G3]EAY23496.1 ThiF family protein [Trichomonas vaginalis G3]KAI5493918.1 ubiquitin-activating enzyme E1 family [Trichomonas vaginalis G3]|eukprot:XP_001584482.1 ThiF family protein [Trichomonas vaginalis G3]
MDHDFVRNSRVMLALGKSTFEKLSQYKVLIVGLSAVGSEIIKDLVLMNVGTIDVFDQLLVTEKDVGSNFFARKIDIGKQRINTILPRLHELNENCSIKSFPRLPEISELQNYHSVVITYPISYKILLEYSEYCYSHNIMFICSSCLGPTGIFYESFTSKFIVTNPKGKHPFKHAIKSMSYSKNSTLYLRDEEVFLQSGQKIRFENCEALPALNGKEVTLEANKNKNITSRCTGINLKEIGQWDQSKSGGFITEVIKPVEISHKSFKDSLDIDIGEDSIRKIFINICRSFDNQEESITYTNEYDSSENNYKNLHIAFEYEYPPIAAAIGAVSAHHVIMYCTHTYLPLKNQWFIIDQRRILPNKVQPPKNDRFDSVRLTIGDDSFSRIRKSCILMLGAGAIGCEYARCLSLLSPGKIIIFDNDKIEPSNLTRQFLYKKSSEGQYKAAVCADAIRENNEEIVVEVKNELFNEKTARELNLKELDAILSGVDTVKGRKFASTLCRLLNIPFVNCGSEGANADGQIIWPNKTGMFEANYGDNNDEIVLSCTLRSYPTSPIHCIQLYKLLFDEEFLKIPNLSLKKENLGNSEEKIYNFVKEIPKSYNDCCLWARVFFERENVWNISDGFKENAAVYDPNNNLHQKIIQTLSVMKANLHQIHFTDEDVKMSPFNVPLKVELPKVEKEIHSNKEWHEMRMKISDNLTVKPFEYDKDNMTNLTFIWSMSNVHAKVYRLQEISMLEALKVSGNVAATIATTGTVAGSICSELLIETFSERICQIFDEKKRIPMNFSVDLETEQEISFHSSVPQMRLARKVYVNPWEPVFIEDNPVILDLMDSIDEKYSTDCLSLKLEYDGSDYVFLEEDMESPINDVIIKRLGMPILGQIPLIPILNERAAKTPLFIVKIKNC